MEKKEELKKSYYAIIPADVRYDKKLQSGAKLLYGEITALCNQSGYCWASNEYFAELYGKKERTIQRWIKSLEKAEFIYSEVKGMKRKIFITQKQIAVPELEEEVEPVKKKVTKKKTVKKSVTKPKAKKNTAQAVKDAAKKMDEKTKKNNSKSVAKKTKPKFTENDLRLAELLWTKLIFNFPTSENRKVKIDEWADDIRKLREIEKATPYQIEFMIVWLQGGDIFMGQANADGTSTQRRKTFEPHHFWSKNILSTAKLRKQWFENLIPQLQSELKGGGNKTKKEQVTGKI